MTQRRSTATGAVTGPGPRTASGRLRGFTLIEMVVTLMVSAIMAVGVISYIGDSISGFSASGQRSRLAAAGRIAVDRIAMEIYNAVPNSVRAQGQCVEFLPTAAATSYIDAPFYAGAESSAGADSFQAVHPTGGELAEAVYAVIFPINTESVYAAANPGPLGAIEAVDESLLAEGRVTIELAQAHHFNRRSPLDRLYLAAQPVSFCVDNGLLFRYQNYGIHQDQCGPDTPDCLPSQLPDRMLISGPLDNTGLTAFRVDSATLRRNALVTINLNFADQDDIVNMRHEVMSRNVP